MTVSVNRTGAAAAASAAADPTINSLRDNKASPIVIRYAESDADALTIHRFLCIVAGPTLPGPIDPTDSIHEIYRVMKDDVALMAINGETIVGSFGIVRPHHWWNLKIPFFANRWLFALPGAGTILIKEGLAIAQAVNAELHIYDESKGRLVILNKSKLRKECHVLW